MSAPRLLRALQRVLIPRAHQIRLRYLARLDALVELQGDRTTFSYNGTPFNRDLQCKSLKICL